MKKQFLQSAAAIVLVTTGSVAVMGTAAIAAPPPPIAAIYNWTGFYFGANIGYSWGQGAVNYSEPALASVGLPTSFSGSNRLNGVIGGIQAGYNWQISNSWVAGWETDIQGSAEKTDKTLVFPYNDGESPGTLTARLSSRIAWFGTLRGRFGYLVTPTTLVYATAGLAYGRVGVSGTFANIGGPGSGFWSFDQSALRAGYAAGAGIEGAVPTFKDVAWKVEYLHIDLGSLSGTGFDNVFGGPFSWRAKFTDDIVRVGVNFRLPHFP